MDKIQKLGVLTYDFEDYQYKEYLYVDDVTGDVYRSFYSEEDENFNGPNPCDLNTSVREYFEETIKPNRMLELYTNETSEIYSVFLFSEVLNQTIHCTLSVNKRDSENIKSVYYSSPVKMKSTEGL